MPKKSESRGGGGRGWAALGGRTRGSGHAEGGGKGGEVKMFRGMSRKGGGNLSRKGCGTKLFMLILPIMAVGAYLFFTFGS